MVMLLSSKIMASLTWKIVPCVENVQIDKCVNYSNIPGYYCQRSAFFVIVTTWSILSVV